MNIYTTMDSPLGELLLVGARSATAPGGTALASLSVPGQKGGVTVRDGWIRDDAAFSTITEQLRAYFSGASTAFDIEFASGGTEFQQRVWRALDEIPYGATVSYGEVTAKIGEPRERVRAVAGAIGANPLLVVRPCHRVLAADGALTGYSGGLDRKQRLLELEHVLLPI
ncbi:methylated-DNA--[protein]-cysteine S-methyltransferase [Nocardia huaxiensis]|uniref:methylated-DNA--[protein]-cysteine S-methyltransferase n=1 Tax=Nocardia huaxiensis TaxID=2755382 RepID=A0A7D6VE89_9NOCA|nr:methylated-DNA--[protein]-cysteine S-methyltransferase [Nocardia huaxiensis]QLY33251.1 methylated-DNA--[protein]-cysteine S-methyltransferase [Nocardia huaxiensis]UFS99816.1 methylated-DNA--[protein]-cysteine S-methyltransferase [Nocardia huaxiensis]